MAIGPGKYDDLCTYVREKTQASGVLVVVINGNKGEGFSCQTDLKTMLIVPDILETIAKQLRKDRTIDAMG